MTTEFDELKTSILGEWNEKTDKLAVAIADLVQNYFPEEERNAVGIIISMRALHKAYFGLLSAITEEVDKTLVTQVDFCSAMSADVGKEVSKAIIRHSREG